jgi:hypothetical protein
MTTNELAARMGNDTTLAEAEAMAAILAERGLNIESMTDEAFFAIIPEAVQRAANYRT